MPRQAASRGLVAMGRRWAEWSRAWDGAAAVPREFKVVGDQVLVFHEFRGTGKRSGIPAADFSGGCVFTLREGKVVRLILCASPSEALEAAGLSD